MVIEATPGLLAGLNTSYRAAFQTGLMRKPPVWDQVAMKVPSTSDREVYAFLGTMSGLREWLGNRTVDDFKSYDFEIRNRHWEKTLRVNRDKIEDDKYGFYGFEAQQLGELAAEHPDELVFSLFSSGFTAKGYDNVSFFNASHPTSLGATASNLNTVALSSASYQDARTNMMTLQDDNGGYLNITPDLLVVPPQLELTARKILSADMIVEGGIIVPNLLANTARLLVAPRLGNDATNWYLLDTTKLIKPFILQVRKDPQLVARTSLTDDNVFDRNEFVWGVDWRGNAGYGLWQLAFGANVA